MNTSWFCQFLFHFVMSTYVLYAYRIPREKIVTKTSSGKGWAWGYFGGQYNKARPDDWTLADVLILTTCWYVLLRESQIPDRPPRYLLRWHQCFIALCSARQWAWAARIQIKQVVTISFGGMWWISRDRCSARHLQTLILPGCLYSGSPVFSACARNERWWLPVRPQVMRTENGLFSPNVVKLVSPTYLKMSMNEELLDSMP